MQRTLPIYLFRSICEKNFDRCCKSESDYECFTCDVNIAQEIYQKVDSKQYVLCRLGDDCTSWPVVLNLEQVSSFYTSNLIFRELTKDRSSREQYPQPVRSSNLPPHALPLHMHRACTAFLMFLLVFGEGRMAWTATPESPTSSSRNIRRK